MPAEHLRALIHERAPGVSPTQLERLAGLPENSIYYLLRPSTVINKVEVEKCKDITRAINTIAREPVDLADVVQALADDAGLPWGCELTRNERKLVTIYRRLAAPFQDALMKMAQSLGHAA